MSFNQWAPYVSVAKRKAVARNKMQKLRKAGQNIQPIEIEGRMIARSFWGKAWCNHLEGFSDYDNRLPRGRTYARNGSVCHLDIKAGKVEAIVSGSTLYNITVEVSKLKKSHWRAIKKSCRGQVISLLDLLKGSFSNGVMGVVTHENDGMFPKVGEIQYKCNCPDWADMCKHIAAVLYGIGARLDTSPELLFLLRGVDHEELIDISVEIPKKTGRQGVKGNLENLFDIDIDIDTEKAPYKRAFTITAKGVVRLRKKLKMNYSQFSKLVGVSPGTIKNWEIKTGRLNLKPENLASLERVVEANK